MTKPHPRHRQTMSGHFDKEKTATLEKRSRLSYILSANRELSPMELKFRNHGYFRIAGLLILGFYFVYCNPEYSYTYTAIRKKYEWEGTEPLFPQYLKIQPTTTSPVSEESFK